MMKMMIFMLIGAFLGWLISRFYKGGRLGLLWNLVIGMVVGTMAVWLIFIFDLDITAGTIATVILTAIILAIIFWLIKLFYFKEKKTPPVTSRKQTSNDSPKNAGIKNLVSQGKIEQAISITSELLSGTEFENAGLNLSRSYNTFKEKCLTGVFSPAEERQEESIITNQLLNLLTEFEKLNIRILKDNFGQLSVKLRNDASSSLGEAELNIIEGLSGNLEGFDFQNLTNQDKEKLLIQIRVFLNSTLVQDVKSREATQDLIIDSHIIQNINLAYNCLAKIYGAPVAHDLFTN